MLGQGSVDVVTKKSGVWYGGLWPVGGRGEVPSSSANVDGSTVPTVTGPFGAWGIGSNFCN